MGLLSSSARLTDTGLKKFCCTTKQMLGTEEQTWIFSTAPLKSFFGREQYIPKPCIKQYTLLSHTSLILSSLYTVIFKCITQKRKMNLPKIYALYRLLSSGTWQTLAKVDNEISPLTYLPLFTALILYIITTQICNTKSGMTPAWLQENITFLKQANAIPQHHKWFSMPSLNTVSKFIIRIS